MPPASARSRSTRSLSAALFRRSAPACSHAGAGDADSVSFDLDSPPSLSQGCSRSDAIGCPPRRLARGGILVQVQGLAP